MLFAAWRRSIASVVIISLCIGAFLALRWIRLDITYWSRSVTVPYRTDTLASCVRLAFADLPGVSASFSGSDIMLKVPHLEGALVKPTPTPQVARIVVYGHSTSVSHLGPAAEEEELVAALLHQLSTEITRQCTGA